MSTTKSHEPIAIVGLGCVLPDAPDVDTFWSNLLEGKSSIREVPPKRWDPERYWSAEKGADKTYAKIGAFVSDDAFNGLDYRMPPNMVEQIDACQRWALSATRQALKDAGYATGLRGDEGKEFDRDRCAVIIGNAMGGETNKIATKRLFWPDARAAIQADPDFQTLPTDKQADILSRSEERYKAETLPVTEDTMPGHLSNVVAGRVANVFDLGGKNFTTDAACASSLAALDAAVATLHDGDADLVIWGGTDRSMDITPYIQFSAIGALSPDGSRPFDKDANGFVMGEGCAMFLLKRLSQAERDGDHIHAVVRGIGSSSDGKGKGITAPNPKGQVKAVRRAYQDAGVDPYTIGYLEAHGTSTPVGDPVELESVNEAFGGLSDATAGPGTIAVGSVKSNIGHLKAAAGAAGILKATLALEKGRIPPSINVRELNPRIDWDRSVFKVQTTTGTLDATAGMPRRAAVSSFGFGGTNFHVVLEQYVPGAWTPDTEVSVQATEVKGGLDLPGFQAHMEEAAALEGEPLVLSAADAPSVVDLPMPTFATTGVGPRLRDLMHDRARAGIAADERVGFHVTDPAEIQKKLELAQKARADPAAARLAFNQGVFLGKGAPDGKVAFLFPGQGTQYVNMGRDLAQKYEIIRRTFEEADEALLSELDGVRLTDILWPTPDTPENRQASEEKLRLTEFTQPAVLAMDTAILRLLDAWGIQPDVVAGHSLGEYGALVAAGCLRFEDALHAVAARGREMAHVKVPDLGKMASISADWHAVQEAIADIDEYVICANKNCPSQTVIAGSSAGVDAAVDKLQAAGMQAMLLPVSAAFHSEIVAPASGPLRKVLGRLDVQPPKVPVITNVGAKHLPLEPDAIRDNLAVQVASPVEWIGTLERMYDEGVRTFIEVGPKRALTGFVADTLQGKSDVRPIFANHPKKGGIQSINELFAFLGATGFRPRLPDLADPVVYTDSFIDPTATFHTAVASTASPASMALSATAADADPRIDSIQKHLDALQAELATMRTPAATPRHDDSGLHAKIDALGLCLDDIGISGISIGLPGADKPLFDEGDWDRILRGENLIGAVPASDQHRIVEKNIVRLVKGSGGQASFQSITDTAEVIKLAGRRGGFDLADWGVDEELTQVLDKTSQYALAAGLEALKDAGIPLQRTYMTTSTGSSLPKAWKLPGPLRDGTGIIFASAFPGYDALVGEISRSLADRYAGRTLDDLEALYSDLTETIEDPDLKERVQSLLDHEFEQVQDRLLRDRDARYEFNRKFLFHVLSMGHSQLAQFLGARGPNTQLNAACASTTQAIAIAEDWIRTGRARRVLVVGADDATSDNLFEWIGSGFLASGAATTEEDVSRAALPFDARRHGMIVGMGAVGVLVEAVAETEERGMRPIARLLATQVSNSAYHGSRLDVDHIADQMQAVVAKAIANATASGHSIGTTAEAVAASTVFMSHETYTPARGGSAAAEIHALRATFGTAADKVVVANTKGFTGHPQGAGLEDAVALKCLQRGTVPPIPHLKEPDPELGELNLSKGGAYDIRYALRLAAGFGSQVAMTFTELVAREDERIADAGTYQTWLAQVTGIPGAATEVVHRTLRVIDAGAPAKKPVEPVATPVSEPVSEPAAVAVAVADDGALERVTAVVAEKTGYPVELLEPDLDLEADLGIDTVKQAELFAELREIFGVPLDESLQLKDYNTLRKVASYMAGGVAEAPAAKSMPAPAAADDAVPPGDPLQQVTAVVAQKTGYPVELLEPDLDLEADLGIDTVKQAELFAELREIFGVALDEALQLSEYNTLRKVAAYMSDGDVAAPVASQPVEDPADVAEDTEAVAKVTQVVAEKTGYPAEMLEPDLDLEADLGIDTVKQAELFAELREIFGVPLDESLQLKDYNTLRKVASYMAQGERPAITGSGPTRPEPTSEGQKETPVRRLVPKPRAEPLPGLPTQAEIGTVLVVGDPDLKHLDAWKAAGYRPTVNVRPDEPLVGMLCLATRPEESAERRVGALFDAAKQHAEALQTGFVAIVTAQDGAHGLSDPRDAGMASLSGLGKSLRKEWPDALVKCIDVHPADAGAADRVLEEVARGGPRTEICYGRDGTRHVIDVVPEALDATMPDVAGKAFIVSGGAQGITAELLGRLADQKPDLLLLGRTELPETAATWAAWNDAEWKAEEGRVIEAMRAAGETPTPVNVQKAVGSKRKAAETHANIAHLMDAGCRVLYAPVDVTDAEKVRQAVAWARERFGAIHGVIHAAGVEISKALADKDRDQFDMVFSIKQQGLRNLLAATQEDALEWLVAFGSVAGRFGNIGQTDYAAANEFLAKEVVRVAKERDIATAFTVAWGPWGEIGMATRGSIMTVLERSGVTPIPTDEGAAIFLAEMATPGIRESVVAGAVGALDNDGQIVAAATLQDHAPGPDPALAHEVPPTFRLIRSIEAMSEDSLAATVILDRVNDPYLLDHAVDEIPLLPGVFGIEAFAEAGALLAPGHSFMGARDIRFTSPLKQHKDTPVEATVHAQRTEEGDDVHVRCRLETTFIGPDGKPHGTPRLHFEGTVVFGDMPSPLRTEAVPKGDGSIGSVQIYPPFFHGPSFQVLQQAGPFVGDEGIADWRAPAAPLFAAGAPDFMTHPLVTEGLFQLCGLRTLRTDGVMSLPAAVERLDVYPFQAPQEARLWCRSTGTDEDGLRRFDAAACTPDGNVLVRFVGYSMIETGVAPQVQATLDGPTVATPDSTMETIRLPTVDGVVFAAQGVDDADADGHLADAEQELLSGLHTPKRAAEWLAGRLAVKDAVRSIEPSLDAREIMVLADDQGAPHLKVRGQDSPARVSVTHRDGLALAAVADGPIGIDLETVEGRSASFWDQSFGTEEQDRLRALGDDALAATCAWAAKEACLKRHGTGLNVSLHALAVFPDDHGGAMVRGPFGAWGVRFFDVAGRVLAVTVAAFDEGA